jgi:DMSO/TMAO reductase YedYZ molybdopterin-dependent catalytic subunit
METPKILTVDGAVENALHLSYQDLRTLPGAEDVLDISRFHPNRLGDGISLDSLLRHAQPRPDANYLTLHASRDDFHVSIPLREVRGEGVVVFRRGDEPLSEAQGGPIRFIIKDPAACHTDEMDDCANVKYLDRIELTVRKGRDTRPTNDAAHAALHAKETHN